jgi:hypothetical protein
LQETGAVTEGEGEERSYKDERAAQENNKKSNLRSGYRGEGTGNKATKAAGHSQGCHEKK